MFEVLSYDQILKNFASIETPLSFLGAKFSEIYAFEVKLHPVNADSDSIFVSSCRSAQSTKIDRNRVSVDTPLDIIYDMQNVGLCMF